MLGLIFGLLRLKGLDKGGRDEVMSKIKWLINKKKDRLSCHVLYAKPEAAETENKWFRRLTFCALGTRN